jgi:hypothetical protein
VKIRNHRGTEEKGREEQRFAKEPRKPGKEKTDPYSFLVSWVP